jgi:hypothetical protein
MTSLWQHRVDPGSIGSFVMPPLATGATWSSIFGYNGPLSPNPFKQNTRARQPGRVSTA